MVSEEEWAILNKNFTVDTEISVTRNKSSQFLLSSDPPVCDECLARRCKEEEEEQLVYRNVTVYVRMLTGAERPPDRDPTDPDFDFVNGGAMNGSSGANKRMKFMTNGGSSPSGNMNGHRSNDFVRRSNRRQKVRGEREFTVSSDMLLRDFKVKVRNLTPKA